jgi:hypothetical protein
VAGSRGPSHTDDRIRDRRGYRGALQVAY